MIKVTDCAKSYRNKEVFENINYSFESGIYHINGQNGAGKSVFCRCLIGLEKFSKGEVTGNLGKILYLPDTSLGESWLNMDESIDLMLYYFGISIDESRKQDIKEKLEIVYGEDLVSQASVGTGMKIGLTLLFVENHWNTIVLDETLSHVDVHIKNVVMEELCKRKNEGTTIFIINHGEICENEPVGLVKNVYLKKNGLSEGM